MWLRQLGLLLRQSAKPLIAVGLLLAAGLAVVAYLDSDQRHVRKSCERAVAEELKSPASAVYEHADTWEKAAGYWISEGTVDSQNEFGAMLRSQFRCDVEHRSGEWFTSASVTRP